MLKSKGITIRLEFVILLLDLLKLQDVISIEWTTILLIAFIPMVLGRILIYYCKKHMTKQIQLGKVTITHNPGK